MKKLTLFTFSLMALFLLSGTGAIPKAIKVKIEYVKVDDPLDVYRMEHNRLLTDDARIQAEYAESFYKLKQAIK